MCVCVCARACLCVCVCVCVYVLGERADPLLSFSLSLSLPILSPSLFL